MSAWPFSTTFFAGVLLGALVGVVWLLLGPGRRLRRRTLGDSSLGARMIADPTFRAKVEAGLSDAAAGRTIALDELKRRLGDTEET